MNSYKLRNTQNIIHYPSLKTILIVEKVLKESGEVMSREEIKKKVPNKIMHQTLNVVLAYLEERGLIVDSHSGVLWTYNPSKKLEKAINEGVKI